MSEAMKYSPAPTPTTSGGPLRAATRVSGASAESSTRAYMPRMRLSDRRTASSSVTPGRISRSTRWATTSVSVSVTKRVPLALQFLLQLEVVLDDAVVDDDQAPRAVAVRVGVLLGRAAVRGPPRVAEAKGAVDRLGPDGVLEARELAGAAAQLDVPVAHDGDARRVVAAILEASQPFEQQRNDWTRADVADDSTHGLPDPDQ